MKLDNMRTVLPKMIKVNFIGDDEKMNVEASSWGWANLLDVCPIMRCHFVRHRAGEWTDFGLGEKMNDDLFGRYGLLNDVSDGKPLFTWAIMSSAAPQLVIKGGRPIHPSVDHHFVHVPMAWVKNAIAAAEQGIVRITSIGEETNIIMGKSPFIAYSLVAHKADGTKLEALWDGGSPKGYRYIEPSETLKALLPK